MDISWLGGSCFFVQASGIAILTDPTPGSRPPVTQPDVITLSQPLSDNKLEQLPAARRVVQSPGEFEIAGAFVNGTRTFGDDVEATRGGNIIYRFHVDRLRVCHLGRLSHVPASTHISAIGDVDVLLLSVGDDSVQPSVAAETVSLLDLKLVIPVSDWPHEGAASPMGRFLKDLGVSPPSPVPNLTVTPASLRDAHRVVALDRAA